MLETIAAIKSNNPRKIPQYDPSLLDHMRKHLRGLMRSPGELRVKGSGGMCGSTLGYI